MPMILDAKTDGYKQWVELCEDCTREFLHLVQGTATRVWTGKNCQHYNEALAIYAVDWGM